MGRHPDIEDGGGGGGGGGSPTTAIEATWPIGTTRYFALDYDAGANSNAGFSDVSMADAFLFAKKTLAEILDVIPPVGAGRQFVLAIKPRAAGATYLKADGVTVDDLTFRGKVGYRYIGIVGTTTGVNDTADKIQSGGIDATGGLGVLTVAAAPAPSSSVFAATVGLPSLVGRRVRFLTGAQANQADVVNLQTTTALANDTITLGENMTGAPSAGDTFVIEQCGVAFSRVAIGLDSTAMQIRPEVSSIQNRPGFVLRGIAAKSTAAESFTVRGQGSRIDIGFCEDDGGGASGVNLQNMVQLNESGRVRDEAATQIRVGSGLRTTGSGAIVHAFIDEIVHRNSCYIGTGQPFFITIKNFALLGAGSAWAVGPQFSNCNLPPFGVAGSLPANIGSSTFSAIFRRLRIFGTAAAAVAGIELQNCGLAIGGVDITGQGAKPLVRVRAQSVGVKIDDLVGTTGNTDVGVDLVDTAGCNVQIGRETAVTGTGTAGDIRMANSALVSYAALAANNAQDSRDNIVSNAAYPSPVVERIFTADMLDGPSSADAAVNAIAPVEASPTNAEMKVAAMDDTTEEGRLLPHLQTHLGSASVRFRIIGQPRTAPPAARTVGLRMWKRRMQGGVAVSAWESFQLTDFAIAANSFFQEQIITVPFSSWATPIVGDAMYQMQVTRINPTGGTELVGDFLLHIIGVAFL